MDAGLGTSAAVPADGLRGLHPGGMSLMQAVMALLAGYALIGAVIGEVVATALVGMVVGLVAGLGAAAAILLICGAGIGAQQ